MLLTFTLKISVHATRAFFPDICYGGTQLLALSVSVSRILSVRNLRQKHSYTRMFMMLACHFDLTVPAY